MAKHSLSTTWPTEVSIDGALVTLLFRRMPVADFLAWERDFMAYGQASPGDVEATQNDPARADGLFTWVKNTLTRHVTLPPDELDIDGEPVTTGLQLYEKYGTRIDFMIGLMNRVWLFHRFEDNVRKNLLSLSGSPATSVVPATEAVGLRPDPTAGNVESAGSASTAAADQVAEPTVTLSGATT